MVNILYRQQFEVDLRHQLAVPSLGAPRAAGPAAGAAGGHREAERRAAALLRALGDGSTGFPCFPWGNMGKIWEIYGKIWEMWGKNMRTCLEHMRYFMENLEEYLDDSRMICDDLPHHV